jgi:hypothetical protein
MLDNFARSVQILITLSGNVESQLTNISSQLDKLTGRKISIDTGPENQLAGAATNPATSITSISDKTKNAERNVVGSFGAIKSSVDEVNAGVGNLISSLAGIAIGGSISGLAWLQSAEAKLYNEQIERAITNNKKLGFTYDDLKKKVEEQVEAGEGTRQDTEKEFYAIIMSANKYIGKGPKALDAADAISDFYFRQQEAMDAQGIGSPEQMIMRLTQTEGKLSDKVIQRYALAMGINPEDKRLRSAKSRVKYIIEQGTPEEEGGFTNMKKELEKRPWEQANVALNRLKTDIGDSLAVPLANLTSLFAGLVDTIRKIPGGSALIGWSAMLLTAVSVLGLLNSVLTPGIKLLQEMVLLTNASTLAKSREILVSKALIVTDWLGLTSKSARTGAIVAETIATAAAASTTARNTGAIGMESVALEIDAVANLNTTGAIFGTTAARTAAIGPTMGLTGATTSLAAAEWAALSPLLLLALPLIAVAGLLYLAETRTHVFSNALDKLSKTEMSKDLIQWLEDVGYWAGYAVDKLGSVMGAGIETGIINPIVGPIEGLDNLYKNFKSGGVLGVLGLGGGEENGSNQMLLISKLFNPLALISEHIATVDETTSWIKGLLGTGWDAINGIYAGIVNFPQNAYKFVVDGIIGFGEWIYNGIVYWATWIYNGILYWAGEVRNAFDSVMKDLGIDDQIDKLKTFIDDVRTSIGDLVSDFNTLVSGLTDKFNTLVDDVKITITGLIDKFTTFVSDIKTSISNLIPGWMGGGTSEPLGEQEAINIVKEMKFDDGSSKFNFSDETYRAAYTEATTGTPQEHPNLANPEKYDKLVAKIADVIRNPSLYQNTSGYNTSNSNLSPHETEINRHEGDIDYEASKQKGITAGYILPEGSKNTGPQIDLASIASENENKKDQGLVNKALNMIGFADGGFVQKTGFALVHEGEPIIPADVASSSRLQNILESIAYGGSSSNTYGDINVRINYTPPSSSTSSNMIVMDRISFEHMVSDIIAKRLRQLNGY